MSVETEQALRGKIAQLRRLLSGMTDLSTAEGLNAYIEELEAMSCEERGPDGVRAINHCTEDVGGFDDASPDIKSSMNLESSARTRPVCSSDMLDFARHIVNQKTSTFEPENSRIITKRH
jgi:hypothetical protein